MTGHCQVPPSSYDLPDINNNTYEYTADKSVPNNIISTITVKFTRIFIQECMNLLDAINK
jgi:hypothetical protein